MAREVYEVFACAGRLDAGFRPICGALPGSVLEIFVMSVADMLTGNKKICFWGKMKMSRLFSSENKHLA